MWKRLCNWIGKRSFRSILCVILMLFTVIPLFCTRQILVRIYEDNIIEDTCNSVTSVVTANNKTLDTILGSIETTAQLIVNSEFYYRIFSQLPEYTVSDYLKCDRLITAEISKLFSLQNEVCDAYFYVPDWLLGEYSGGNPRDSACGAKCRLG